jgi:hypothetical protein
MEYYWRAIKTPVSTGSNRANAAGRRREDDEEDNHWYSVGDAVKTKPS